MWQVGYPTLTVTLALALVARPPLVFAQDEIGPRPSPDSPRIVVVEMKDFAFDPPRITVHRGDVVRFVQASESPHNVEFRAVPRETRLQEGAATPVVQGSLRVGKSPAPRLGPFVMAKGDVYEIEVGGAFATGIHDFVCTPHEPMGMTGALVVLPPDVPVDAPQEGGGTAPTG